MAEVNIVKDQQVIERLSLDEIEPISNVTFRVLAQESPQLIIARVVTRDRTNFRKKYVHHYFGPNLIKILFSTF